MFKNLWNIPQIKFKINNKNFKIMKKLFKIIMTAAIIAVCMMSCKKDEPVKPELPESPSEYSIRDTEWRMTVEYRMVIDSADVQWVVDTVNIAVIDLNFTTESSRRLS